MRLLIVLVCLAMAGCGSPPPGVSRTDPTVDLLRRNARWTGDESQRPPIAIWDFQNVKDVNAAIPRLKEVPPFQVLLLDGQPVSRSSLEVLRDLPALRTLTFDAAPIGDAELELIGSLKQLTALSLYQTKVTARGVAALEKLTGLRELNVLWTDITEEGMKRLKQALPSVRMRSFDKLRVY